MAISLTEQDKEAIRYHLGYNNIQPSTSISLGFPSTNQQLYLVETAMERLINQNAVSRVQRIIGELNSIEDQISDSRKRLKAQQLGELKIRNSNDEATESTLLADEYCDWAQQLASQLGVPINANANPRLRRSMGTSLGTYRVRSRG